MLIFAVVMLISIVVDATVGTRSLAEIRTVAMHSSTVVASLSGAKELAHGTAPCARSQSDIHVSIRGGIVVVVIVDEGAAI
jgi:hypothetical protein